MLACWTSCGLGLYCRFKDLVKACLCYARGFYVRQSLDSVQFPSPISDAATCLGVDKKYLWMYLLLMGLKDYFLSLCSFTSCIFNAVRRRHIEGRTNRHLQRPSTCTWSVTVKCVGEGSSDCCVDYLHVSGESINRLRALYWLCTTSDDTWALLDCKGVEHSILGSARHIFFSSQDDWKDIGHRSLSW